MDNVKLAIEAIKVQLMGAETIRLDDFDPDKTILAVIDMNKGFAQAGALYSPRVGRMIPDIVELSEKALLKGIKVYAYTDHHPEDAKEFSAYPSHCVGNTEESELVDPLAALEVKGLTTIFKNSTNGILAHNPAAMNLGISSYLVVGCVTDICVYQYAVTLRAYLNEHQLDGEVYVCESLVQTFDIEGFHHGDLMHGIFLKSMMDNGVKVVKEIKIS
ncbi:isochorismatase family cysteine hydrolase [Petrocella sp. FN5]|uniref:isochorismatase family cysteine hydrolase n=1 Tax=Petrocella sp. FN5 TaxID=3032002 RepID=UPI0023DBCDBF|nr:isochorismatase family cysteine hydrolase [Petrocella sp. FN5]MDF1617680.1 cysteine hydrolase [Petrocella sp. FN5]